MECYVITIMDNENSISSAKRTIHSAQRFGKKGKSLEGDYCQKIIRKRLWKTKV